MPHSYAHNFIHLVFSTKDRRPLLDKELRPRLWAYISGICKNDKIHLDAIGGTDDHIHLLIRIPADLSISKATLIIKASSSKWISQQGRRFAWQEGYGAFSVSASLVPRVSRYINTQETHHRKLSFGDEFTALLKKHAVDFDPKFVFG
jgi:putative transposase